MKKLAQKLNTQKTRSIVLGLVLAIAFSIGGSLVVAQGTQNSDNAELLSFDRVSRIGSLAIGSVMTPAWFSVNQDLSLDCMRQAMDEPEIIANVQSCFSVMGSSLFTNLLVNQNTHIIGSTLAVGDGTNLAPASAAESFDIQTIDVDDGTGSLMASSLMYGGANAPAPRDLTTQRAVCADNAGILIPCAGGETTTTPPGT